MADESDQGESLYEVGGFLNDFFDSLDDDVGSRAGDSSTLSAHSPPYI